MQKKLPLIFSVILITAIAWGQVIPLSKRVIWTGAGIPTNNPVITNEINVKSFGAHGDSVHDDANAIVNAMTSLGGRAGIVYFPPGEYLIESTLNIPDSVILRGDCNDSAQLVFNLGGAAIDCIDAQVNETTTFQNIISEFSKDTNVIKIDSTNLFHVGDYAEIEETNGPWNVVPASWAVNCVGQIVHITAINGHYITFENPLRIAYTPSLIPQIRKWIPRVFVGIEDLNITRIDTGLPATGYQISFNNAMNCWVKGVQSSHSVGAHVSVDVSTNITISGCYFHDAYAYDGNGTRGYGVMLIQHTGQCLVENNVFEHLRHSVIMKQGANGNIAGYNYAINEYRVEFPTDAGADLVCHGHYSFANLFEGNIVNTIQVDSTWGPTGPYTTFYRNRAALYGIIMTPGASVLSDSLNFVGNETTNNSLLHGLFYLAGINQYEYGNNILGIATPVGTTNLTDTFYYRTNFTGIFYTSPYPPTIGFPNILNSGTIPAMQRYIAGGKITVSANPPCPSLGIHTIRSDANIIVYPNPTNQFITVVLQSSAGRGQWAEGSGQSGLLSGAETTVEVYNVLGEQAYSTFNTQHSTFNIDVRSLSNGVYFLKIYNQGYSSFTKFVVEK